MALVTVNLEFPKNASGQVEIEELTNCGPHDPKHLVRFFHVKFEPDHTSSLALAKAIAADPRAFYKQCREINSLDLPDEQITSDTLWTRIQRNLANDVLTITDLYAVMGPIPVCAAFLVTWEGMRQKTFLDFRICISTHMS